MKENPMHLCIINKKIKNLGFMFDKFGKEEKIILLIIKGGQDKSKYVGR
jgi:hypothetical protein